MFGRGQFKLQKSHLQVLGRRPVNMSDSAMLDAKCRHGRNTTNSHHEHDMTTRGVNMQLAIRKTPQCRDPTAAQSPNETPLLYPRHGLMAGRGDECPHADEQARIIGCAGLYSGHFARRGPIPRSKVTGVKRNGPTGGRWLECLVFYIVPELPVLPATRRMKPLAGRLVKRASLSTS